VAFTTLVNNFIVGVNSLQIKFVRSVQISSLLDENFVLTKASQPSSPISSPFRDINTLIHYNSISRALTLFWNVVLEANTEYVVTISNLKDGAGLTIGSDSFSFTTPEESATPSSLISTGTVIEEILIQDKSVKVDFDTGYQIIAKNPEFYVKEVQPSNGSFYIDNSENNGRVTITFNQRPASNFLTSKYFKVQRKLMQRAPSRWENVPAQVSIHSWKPDVFIDFPSDDTTPVYYVDDKTYYQTGYKYRIIVSSEVGV
jgi:hypothetical protein